MTWLPNTLPIFLGIAAQIALVRLLIEVAATIFCRTRAVPGRYSRGHKGARANYCGLGRCGLRRRGATRKTRGLGQRASSMRSA